MIGKLHEHTFNIALAAALRKTNSRWHENKDFVKAERQDGIRKDIEIQDPRLPPLVIECEYEDVCQDKDAIKRLNSDPNLDTAISLAIPVSFKPLSETDAYDALISASQLKYAVFQREISGEPFERFPSGGYLKGSVANLGTLIQMAAAPKKLVEKVAEEVAESVNRAAWILEQELPDHVVNQIVEELRPYTGLTSLRVVGILWLDAMMVQSHLVHCGASVGHSYIKPLTTKPNADVSTILSTWRLILTRNWRSIFEKAISALEIASASNYYATTVATTHLVKAVRLIESTHLTHQFQIGAELFPLMIQDRKKVAAYYTTPATAELLSTLLIRESDPHDWKDFKVFENIQIADLACGTGTLLRAGYKRIERLLETSGCTEDELSNSHKLAMEHAIKGADISPIASHLSNSGMALLGRGEPYNTTHIGWVTVGKSGDSEYSEYRTGSLEFLRSEEVEDLLMVHSGSYGGTNVGESNSKDQSSPIGVRDNFVDYMLMNPPYTVSNGKQGAFEIDGLSMEDRHKCQERWGKLLQGNKSKKNPLPKIPAMKSAGMAASFLCIANIKLKPGGRLGFVLPLTAAFGTSWERTREMLVTEFHDIVVVTRAGQFDAEALSADTGQLEMLLIATKNESAYPGGGGDNTTLHYFREDAYQNW